jgi:hypothetical protein
MQNIERGWGRGKTLSKNVHAAGHVELYRRGLGIDPRIVLLLCINPLQNFSLNKVLTQGVVII